MADLLSIDDAIAKIRRLSGQETIDEANAFVTDDEIAERYNANLRIVYAALVKARGAKYFTKTAPDITTVAGTSDYSLPSDFFALKSVSWKTGQESFSPMFSYNENERHDYDAWPVSTNGSPIRYTLEASKLRLIPTPQAGVTIRVRYEPSFVPLVRRQNPAQTFDGVCGFEEWAVWLTVAELLAKDKDDPSFALSRAQWWEAHVKSLAAERDATLPDRVERVRARRRRERFC